MAEKTGLSMRRVSRACTFCRARKSRCDLEASGGAPPCGRCKKENRECVLGTSNRGGSRVRKKNVIPTPQPSTPIRPSIHNLQEQTRNSSTASGYSISSIRSPAELANGQPTSAPLGNQEDDDEEEEQISNEDSPIDNTIPRNPSDAWQLLTDVAARGSDQSPTGVGLGPDAGGTNHGTNGQVSKPRESISSMQSGILSYRLVREGYLTPDIIHALVSRYAEHYHCYLPLVPRKYFDSSSLDHFAAHDKHLLTAVLTIASKELVDQPQIHQSVSRYMHDLISGIAAGHDCEVEAVEALLLLAEWEPQGLRNNIEAVGRGEEDRSAWMHVGMALRTGYFLGLDRTAFRQDSTEEANVDARKRLAWANCYVSDRLISVRIGRAFWSRGPGPMTGLSSHDFPTLQPSSGEDEDYAKIFQATLDLTQLYSNVHDVLYSGMRTSGQMMLMGDYVKYVDDFRTAIDRWHSTWGRLECSQNIKVTLQMSFEYLRLYTNAFVFQAQISQAIASRPKREGALRDHLRRVFSNIGSMPDARFIWASVASAKSFLTVLGTQIDPVKHLRYMPLRFYLYTIYSAVFLYKARSFGVMNEIEERQVQNLICQAMDALKKASLSPQDAGSRYARLLELLWMKPPKMGHNMHYSMQSPAARSDTQLSSSGSIKLDAGGYMQYSPANDFSWLDLEAVGDYVSGDPMAGTSTNILAPMIGYQAPTQYMQPSDNDNMRWQRQANMMNSNFQFDLNGNLLF